MNKYIILLNLIFVISCSSGESSTTSTTIEEDYDSAKTSICGAVSNKTLSTTIPKGELAQIEIIDTDLVLATKFSDPTSKTLIKFHGLTSAGVNNYRALHGMDLLNKNLSGGATFVIAGNGCEYTTSTGQKAALGQVFTPTGESISELILTQGSALPQSETCSGDLLASCYNSLRQVARPPSDAELDLQSVNISTRCGAVKEGQLINPITKAELVSVKALSADSVIVTRKTGIEAGKSQLVKLHGLSTSGLSNTANSNAVNYINNNLSSSAYLVVGSQNCQVDINGGPGVTGQLYGINGASANEELLSKGFTLSTTDSCQGELISSCYQTIQSAAPVINDPAPPEEVVNDDDETINGGADYIDDFLWKPISDNTGKLAVLVNPYNVKIVVTGAFTESLRDGGAGNGRGTTGRGNRPGCDYGTNIKVEFFNSEGGRINLKDGRTSVNISDGCKRIEFKLR